MKYFIASSRTSDHFALYKIQNNQVKHLGYRYQTTFLREKGSTTFYCFDLKHLLKLIDKNFNSIFTFENKGRTLERFKKRKTYIEFETPQDLKEQFPELFL